MLFHLHKLQPSIYDFKPNDLKADIIKNFTKVMLRKQEERLDLVKFTQKWTFCFHLLTGMLF